MFCSDLSIILMVKDAISMRAPKAMLTVIPFNFPAEHNFDKKRKISPPNKEIEFRNLYQCFQFGIFIAFLVRCSHSWIHEHCSMPVLALYCGFFVLFLFSHWFRSSPPDILLFEIVTCTHNFFFVRFAFYTRKYDRFCLRCAPITIASFTIGHHKFRSLTLC